MCREIWMCVLVTMGLLVVQFSGLGARAEVAGENFSKGVKKLALAEELFPEAKLVWGRTFKGRMLDFRIAKESGHVAIAAVDDETKQATVYYFDPDGALLWKLNSKANTNLSKVGKVNLSISEDGEILLVSWWWDELSEIQVYDKQGKLLFKKIDTRFIPTSSWMVSPRGTYVISGNRKALYTCDGTPINIVHPDPHNWYYYRFQLLSDDIVIGFAREKFSDAELREHSKKWLKERREELSKSNLDREEAARITKRLDHLERMLSQGYSKPPGVPEPPSRTQLCVLSLPDAKVRRKIEVSKEVGVSGRTFDGYFFLRTEESIKGKKKCSLFNLKQDGTLLWEVGTALPTIWDDDLIRLTKRNYEIAVYAGGADIYTLDNRTGKILTHYQLDFKNTPVPKYCFIWDQQEDKQRIILSGRPPALRRLQSPSGSYQQGWNWTYVLKLDAKGNITDKLLRHGLLVASFDSKVIGVYQSESETIIPKIGERCSDFTVNILKREG